MEISGNTTMEQRPEPAPKDPINLKRARDRLSRNSARDGMDRLRKAICDPARLKIIEALSVGELSVNDLAIAIDRAPAATSQHLKILRQLGLVDSVRHGTSVHYHLQQGAAVQLEGVLSSLASLPAASNV
jgi:DNA-binding transcriptional ArsR family regulator